MDPVNKMPSLLSAEVESYIAQAKENLVQEPIHFSNFVEAGTYLGETIDNIKNTFQKVYTIEVSEKLYKQAKHKFQGASNVTCFHGDSATLLKNLLPLLTEPTVFWLDAHWSMGNTAFQDVHVPLYKELDVILSEMKETSLVIVDDVRLFGKRDYEIDWTPISVEKILEKAKGKLLTHWFAASSLHPNDRLIMLFK